MELPSPSSEQQTIIANLLIGKSTLCNCIAGAGKSTASLQIATVFSDKKLILLTYSKTLQSDSEEKATLTNTNNIDIYTFNAFAYNFYSKDSGHNLKKALNISSSKKFNYDIIILDEVQDSELNIYHLSLQILYDNLNSPEKTLLCILGDACQCLYKYKGADEKFITLAPLLYGLQRTWSICKLSQTFRINNASCKFLNQCVFKENKMISYEKEAKKVLPRYIICDMFTYPIQEVMYYLNLGYKPGDIFIIAPSIKTHEKSPIRILANELTQRNIPIFYPISDEEIFDSNVIKGKIGFGSIHSMKGKENNIIIFMGADIDYFNFYNKDDPRTTCPNPLYVAFTRHKRQLSLLHSYKSDYLPFLDQRFLRSTTHFIEQKSLQVSNKGKFTPTKFTVSKLLAHISDDTLKKSMEYITAVEIQESEKLINIKTKIINNIKEKKESPKKKKKEKIEKKKDKEKDKKKKEEEEEEYNEKKKDKETDKKKDKEKDKKKDKEKDKKKDKEEEENKKNNKKKDKEKDKKKKEEEEEYSSEGNTDKKIKRKAEKMKNIETNFDNIKLDENDIIDKMKNIEKDFDNIKLDKSDIIEKNLSGNKVMKKSSDISSNISKEEDGEKEDNDSSPPKKKKENKMLKKSSDSEDESPPKKKKGNKKSSEEEESPPKKVKENKKLKKSSSDDEEESPPKKVKGNKKVKSIKKSSSSSEEESPPKIKNNRFDKYQENVSELTGLAIPSYYEFINTNKMTIFNEFIKYKDKQGRVKYDIVIDYDKLSEQFDGKFDAIRFKDGKTISSKAPVTEQILYLANLYNSYVNNLSFKVNQIKNYEWLSQKNLDDCCERLKKRISNNSIYEHKISYEGDNFELKGIIDCISEPLVIEKKKKEKRKNVLCYESSDEEEDKSKKHIYEFKCVTELQDVHKLQVALYMFLWYFNNNPPARFFLFNILDNCIYEILAKKSDLLKLVNCLINAKNSSNNKSEEDFLRETSEIYEKVFG